MSDALHNFSDVVSLIISYIASVLSEKKASLDKSYGYKRAEILAAFINAISLIAIAIFLIIEAVERLNSPVVINSDIVIYFALASILFNLLSVILLHNDSKDSMNIKSAYLHLMTDVMTSIAVMMGGIMMKFYEIYWFDSVLSLIIAVYLVYSTIPLLRDSMKVLMQFSPSGVKLEDLADEISKIDGVESIHHIHIWRLNDASVMFEGHLEMSSDCKISDFQSKLKHVGEILKTHGINHFNIQPELDRCHDKESLISSEHHH